MSIFLYITLLILETLYYSLFMKFVRPEGKFGKYLLMFTIITLIGIFIGTGNTLSYLLLVLTMLLGIKYIVGIKTTLFDCFTIVIMILFGIVVQLPCYLILNKIISNLYLMIVIYQVIKILILLLIKNKLCSIIKTLHIKWDNNNFYIRYLFSILTFLYVIATCIFIITLLL